MNSQLFAGLLIYNSDDCKVNGESGGFALHACSVNAYPLINPKNPIKSENLRQFRKHRSSVNEVLKIADKLAKVLARLAPSVKGKLRVIIRHNPLSMFQNFKC